MAISRIGGKALKSDLARDSNLTFNTDTLVVDYTNGRIGIGVTSPTNTLSVTGSANVDNIKIDGNAITSTNTNGNITISPDGNGSIDVDTSQIVNVTDPTGAQHAATKAYVDSQVSSSAVAISNIDIDGGTDIGAALVDADLFIVDDGASGTNRKSTLSRLKTYIGVGATAADDIAAGDGAVNITTTTGNITIDAQANDSDIIFKGTDGSADTTFLTIDGSAAGEAIFNAGIVIADAGTIGSASDKNAITIAADGVVTMDQIPVFSAGINVSGGTIAGTLATAAQGNITSLGTLTALQVDNLNINGNTISSTAGTDLNITPLAGQQIVLDGTIVIDAGVVTGATSITSTAFVGNITGDVTGTADVATVATTVTITDNESTNENNALIFTAGGDVDGGNLGLESDGTLTYNPSTGKVTATGFVGALTGDVTGNADTATALETARTIGGVSFDGTGNINLPGVNTSGNQDTSGTAAVATVATTVTITDNESTNESNAIIFTAGGAQTGGNLGLESDGTLTYNPSTGVVTATGFAGALTGNVTGNVSGTAATVTGAAQSAITSLGTLTTLTVDNIIINGTTIGHTSDTDSISIASNGVVTLSQRSIHSGGITIADGGNIGSVSDTDAIEIAATGDVTFSQAVTITGNLTINGTTTTVSSTNTVIEDTLIELNTGASSNANDMGLIMERGSTGDNAIFMWDESADKFTLGTTAAVASATGNISVSTGTLVANIEGSGAGLTAGTTPLTTIDIDGGTDIGAGLADADLFIVDDGAGGTNRKTAASRIKTYIADVTLTTGAQTNITSVGALDGGSITSNFGTINTGSSAITTTGAVSGGSFVVADAGNIGSASDTDAIAIASGGAVTFSQRSVHSAGITIADGGQIGSASDADAIAIASDGVVTFSQAPVFPDGSINIADIDLDGGTDIGAAIADADLFLIDDGAGGTMRKTAASRLKTYIGAGAADDLTAGDAAVTITTTTGNITIDAQADDSDIILKGTDGGVDTTFLTIDGSAAGKATFNNEVVSGAVITSGAGLIIADDGNIGSASDTDAIAISSSGVVTMNQIPVFSAGINVSGGTIAGTLATAAQGNITSLGTLTALTVDDIAVNGKVITMTGSTDDTAVFTVGTNGTLTIETTDTAAAAANIQITADGTFEVDATTITLDSAGDIVLDADGADVIFKDAGTEIGRFTNSSTDFVMQVATQDKDIVFKGDDGGSGITALTLDMSDAGKATFNGAITGGGLLTTGGNIVIPDAGNIGSASDTDAIAIASNGVVTFSQAPVFPDGSIAVADLDIDGGTDIGADLADADLFIVDDGAGGTNRKTAASRIKTYIADVTLTTAAQTNITSLGTLTALTVDDVAINGKVMTMTGSTDDTAVFTVGTNGTLSIVTTDTAAAAANIQITADGTAELAGTTVTLDSGGDIVLDADGADVIFKDAGTSILTITNNSTDVDITVATQDKDINFKGDDGGSGITALTLDMSDAGTAVFNHDIRIADGGLIGSASDADAMQIASTGDITISQDLTVTGNLTINGTTVTTSTDNQTISDSLMELNSGASSNSNDLGIVMERGSTGDNAIIAWDESADKFIVGTTTATGASTGNLSITTGTLVADLEGDVTGNVSGTAATVTGAAQSAITSLGTLTTLTVDNIIINGTNIGHTSDTDSIAIASNGVVTFSQAPVFPDGSIAVADLDIDGGTDIGADLADADLLIVDDGAGGTNRKTAMSRVKTYVADVTLTTAAQTNITSLGTLTALTVDDVAINGKVMTMTGSTDDTAVFTVGTNGTLTIETTDTAAAAANIQITADGTFEVDATTVTLDSAGDIVLDADGADVIFKDAGTAIGTFTNSSSDFVIQSNVQDKDILFKGDDGGSGITALTLDMSDAGKATFNGAITGGGLLTTGGNIVIPDAGNIGSASDTDAIAIASDGVVTMNQIPVFSAGINVSGGTIAGTLATAAQTNITSVGTLTALTVDDVAINGKVITMTGSTDDTAVFTVGTNGTLSIVTTDTAAAAANIQITADGTAELAGTTVTLDSGGDIVLDADGADVIFKDAGTEIGRFTNSSTDFVMQVATQDKDIVFKGDDGGSGITALTLDMSDAGKATFNGAITGGGLLTTGGNIVIPDAGNIGSASDTDAIAIASDGVVTMNQIPVFSAGINVSGGTIAGTLATAAQGNITSLGTLTTLTVDNIIINGTNIGHTSDTDSIAIASNGVVTFSQTPVFSSDITVTDDIYLDSDGSVIHFGDDGEVTLTHVHNQGLRMEDSDKLTFGAGDDLQLYHDGSNSYIDDAGDGSIFIRSGTTYFQNAGGTKTSIQTNAGAGQDIYHNNTVKLTTTSNGITVSGGIIIADAGNIGSASDTDAIAIASDGVVTFSQAPVFPDGSIAVADLDIDGATDIGAAIADADLIIVDDGAGGTNRKATMSRLKTYMGLSAGALALTSLDIDGGTDIGADLADADLFIVDDGAGGTNRKTAASRIKTYVADVTLTTAAQTNITSLGTLTALTVDDVAVNGKVITMTGSTDDTAVFTVGTNGTLTIETTDTAAAAANIQITADGTFEVDATTVTLDSAGDIVLDADGADVIFKDAGTEIGRVTNSSTDLVLEVATQDKDILFKGDDGGSGITALTLDMSDAGTAVFNHDIRIADGGLIGSASDADAMSISSAGLVTFTQDISVNSRNDVRFYDSDNSNYVSLRAGATVSSNVTWTLPTADGTSGQFLKTDGAGNLSFGAAGSGGGSTGFSNSTITTAPGASDDYDLAEGTGQDGDETPFEAGGQDAFGVSLGTVYDNMEPTGSTTTIDYGDGEAYVGA